MVESQYSGFNVPFDPEYARCLPSEKKIVNNLGWDEE